MILGRMIWMAGVEIPDSRISREFLELVMAQTQGYTGRTEKSFFAIHL
jgi:hypothetical protein